MKFDYERSIWGEGTASLNPGDPTSIRLKYALEALQNLAPGSKVLEFGCGAGQFIRGIKKLRPDLQCFGFDISQSAIESARAVNDGVEYSFHAGGIMPYEKGFFDAVVILDVLEHVEDPGNIMKQVNSIINNGGLVYTFVPCEGDALSFWNLLRKFGIGVDLTKRFAGHIQYFSRNVVLRLFRDSGMNILRKNYSEHVLGQLLGIAAFFGMNRYSENNSAQINNEAFFKRNGASWLKSLKKIINGMVYFESMLLRRVPSPNLHILAKKQ